ncbi:hypothetical protein ACFL3V_06810, partial [Nanoarchaeota archaeon]
KERRLMQKHVKKVGWKHLLLTYAFVLLLIVIIETFASLNIYLLRETDVGIPVLRELFSTIAIFVAVFTVIANIIFMGGSSKTEREFQYYFRTRPLLLFSTTAIVGDIFAVYLVGRVSYPYIVFFTSLIALNVFTFGFAIYGLERYIRSQFKKV